MSFREFELRSQKRKAITSYGIILFTVHEDEILYLLSQRRDSISYSEFLRNNLTEDIVEMHINLMSSEERARCIEYYEKNDPLSLWNDLWVNHHTRMYRNEGKRCCEAFMENMRRYLHLFQDAQKRAPRQNPWGFTKGRKHDRHEYKETDLNCALREFEEECTINRNRIQVLNLRPYEEIYTGTDGKLYRTVYYIAFIEHKYHIPLTFSHNTIRKSYVSEEVNRCLWASYQASLKLLDINKQQILRDLNSQLLFSHRRPPPRRRRSI